MVGEGGGEEIEEGFGVWPSGEGEGGIEGSGEGGAGAIFEADGGEGEGEMVLDFGVGREIGGGFFEEGESFGVLVFEEEDPAEGIGDGGGSGFEFPGGLGEGEGAIELWGGGGGEEEGEIIESWGKVWGGGEEGFVGGDGVGEIG